MRLSSWFALTSALVLSCSAPDHPTTDTQAQAQPIAVAAQAEARFAVPLDGLPVLAGDDDALVTIVEFTDYECPFCAKAEKTVAALRESYGRDLRVVVAMHPLPMHPHARDAALVALGASPSSFPMAHARLFGALGVAGEHESRAPFESLATAESLGSKLHVRGTPMFFVNGKRISGAQPYATFDTVVSHELATARALVASGVRRSRVYDVLLDQARESPAPLIEDDDTPKVVPAAHGVSGLPFLGRDDAAHTIVLFTDLECPYCKRLDARLREYVRTHDGVRVVFRNHPLPMHSHARLAAKAAIAASAQNGLARYVEIVFAHPDALDRAALVSHASQAGLDVSRFTRDLDSDETTKALATDDALAETLGVKGTPTSFVDDKLIVGAQPVTTFEEALH